MYGCIRKYEILQYTEEKMNNYTFRPFNYSDNDYQNRVDIWNTIWSDEKTTVERVKFGDNLHKDKFAERFVCEENGRFISYGVYGKSWWSQREGKYFLNMLTLPKYRNNGIGSSFYNQATERLQQRGDLKVLTVDTREDMPQSIQFLKNRGFKQVMRYPRSILDVQAFELEKYSTLVNKLEQKGIEFLNVNQLAERFDDYQQRFHAMETEIDKDIPSPDPFKPDPFDEFQKRVFNNPNFYPEAVYIAVDNDQFVGISALWKTPEDNKLSTGLTGVLRSHRRLGLATALKSKALGFAKAQAIVEIDTDNEENNPMYQINMQLGFKPAPAYLDFYKEIDQ